MLRTPLLTLVPLLWPLATQAQTQAACTFNFFSPTTTITLHNGSPVFIQPLGINDFGTIVGYSIPGTSHRGLIRWANGGVTRVKGTSGLMARNDHGTSVGEDLTPQAILVNGTTLTPIVLDVNNGGVTEVSGINKWGTVVGQYRNPGTRGRRLVDQHGFKRWKNGTTRTLDFPGALPGSTFPLGINDLGTVVGSYFIAADHSFHGFIFHNGQWATLDYPHASYTDLVGITNSGKIIGHTYTSSRTPFLYENGTFKVISIPNSDPDLRSLMSISPKQGLILGTADHVPGHPGFIAQCQ